MSILWNVIRGGQTRLHNIRMFFQITKRVGIIGLVCYVVFVGIFFFKKTTAIQRNFAWQWSYSKAAIWCKFNPDSSTNFTYYRNGRPLKAVSTHRKVINNQMLVNNFYQTKSTFISGLKWGVGFIVFFVFIICWYLYAIGFHASKEKIISGLKAIPQNDLKKLLRKRLAKEGDSGINLAEVQLTKTMDTTHTFIVGASGAGKSVLCRELLSSIRSQGKRAIIYDVSGEFAKNFYQPDKDILLNPLDNRSARWDLWLDCKRSEHFHSLAEALIPNEGRNVEDFFIKAARAVLSNIAERLSFESNPSLHRLLDLLLIADFSTLIKQVKGTEAAALLNKEGGRTAASVRAVIAANIKSMSYLRTAGQPFSLRQWIREETHPAGFIFITSNDEQLPLLKPLITLWVNIATSAILGLEPDRDRRIYLLLDELASLNRVPALHPFLAQGRKYGGGAILCTQGYSQMVDSLGEKETKALASGCSNWAVLRCNDADGAEWLSKSLCRQESIEKSEGVSYGSHEMRDSVSLQEQRRERPLVSPSEILNLPDLTGYLRLGRGLPLAKFEVSYVDYPVVAEPFVEVPADFRELDTGSEPVIPEGQVDDKSMDSPFLG